MILIKTGKPNNLEHLSPSYKICTIFKHTQIKQFKSEKKSGHSHSCYINGPSELEKVSAGSFVKKIERGEMNSCIVRWMCTGLNFHGQSYWWKDQWQAMKPAALFHRLYPCFFPIPHFILNQWCQFLSAKDHLQHICSWKSLMYYLLQLQENAYYGEFYDRIFVLAESFWRGSKEAGLWMLSRNRDNSMIGYLNQSYL